MLTENSSLDSSRGPLHQGGTVKEDMAGSHGKKEIINVSISSDMPIREIKFKRHYSYTCGEVWWE